MLKRIISQIFKLTTDFNIIARNTSSLIVNSLRLDKLDLTLKPKKLSKLIISSFEVNTDQGIVNTEENRN